MKILVCVKELCGLTGAQIGRFGAEANERWPVIDPSDLDTLEEAMRLRAASGGNVTAITVGPPEADPVMKKALMMGADEVFRVWDNRLNEIGALGVSMILAAAVSAMSPDVILCAARSEDLSGEMVGTFLAERIGLPLITRATHLRLDTASHRILADRKIPLGECETCAARLPAVLTIERTKTELRYASEAWVRRMSKEAVRLLSLEELRIYIPLPEEPIKYLKVIPPRLRTKLKTKVAGLSLKDKLAMMRGAKQPTIQTKCVGERPEAAAKRIKEHLDLWLRSGT